MSRVLERIDKQGLRRRFLETVAGSTTVIGARTLFVGDIRGAGTFLVLGDVRGDGDINGSLNIAASASWHGIVHAKCAIVAGQVSGGLVVEGKLEIGCTAVIHGQVKAGTVAIAKGAVLDGDMEITSGGAPKIFEEKRTYRD